MEIDFVYLLYLVQNLSPILGFVAYFLVVDDVPRHNHLIFAYLVTCFFADGFTYFKMLPTPIVFNIHDMCQFFIIMMIYSKLFHQRAIVYLATTIVVYVAGITATITVVGLNVYHNYMWALSGLLVGILCIVYMSVVNAKPAEFANNKDLYNTLVMNGMFLFYFLSTFAFFLFADLMFKKMNDDSLRVTWLYHNSISILKNTGLAVAIFLTGRAKTTEVIPEQTTIDPAPKAPQGRFDLNSSIDNWDWPPKRKAP